MLQLLKRKTETAQHSRAGAPSLSLPETSEDGFSSHQVSMITKVLNDLECGIQPDLAALPSDIATSVGQLAKILSVQNQTDLATTVEFSVQASESMSAVSLITGDVREIDSNAQAMASAIEELDASIAQISATATNSSAEMQEASGLMSMGTQKVRETAEAAQNISAAMNATETEANHVVDAVEKISTFIGTIEGIAKQTNLLALNATIEAARAGDAGRGFAIVASEVKTLSGQTQTATEDISKLIEGLQEVVNKLFSSVEGARLSVSSAQELTVQTEQDITSVNEIVGRTASGIEEIASVLNEQSMATKELARGVDLIAQKSSQATECANIVIQTVQKSEQIIERKFAELEGREIKNYVLFRGKSDHCLWKKRLSEMLVGLNTLTADELSDHHSCRLGKWYDTVTDTAFKGHPAYQALDKPHADVHKYGKLAASQFALGDRDGALEAIGIMESASDEVIRILEELIDISS